MVASTSVLPVSGLRLRGALRYPRLAFEPFAQPRGAIEEQLAIACIAGERRRALELRAGVVHAADFGEEVAADARQQVVAWKDGSEVSPSALRPARKLERNTRLGECSLGSIWLVSLFGAKGSNRVNPRSTSCGQRRRRDRGPKNHHRG